MIIEEEVFEDSAVMLEYTNVFNAHNLVKDLIVNPEDILIFEIQGNPQSKSVFYRPEDFDIYSGAGTGYPLWRNREDEEALNLDLGRKVDEE